MNRTLNRIPHRAPVLLIDRVLEVGPSVAIAESLVGKGPWVGGGEMLELGLVEGLAQTAAALLSAQMGSQGAPVEPGRWGGMLVGVRNFEVKRRARAREKLTFRVELIKLLAPLAVVRGTVAGGEEILASGELKFFAERGGSEEE